MTQNEVKLYVTQAADDAKTANIAFLDNEIFEEHLIELFYDHSKDMVKKYQNVPIRELIAARHRDFYKKGESWRVAAPKMDFPEWEKTSTIGYFTSPLKGVKFPFNESPRELELMITGGAISCKWGSNRVVAGMVIKAFEEGANAEFEQVCCFYRPLEETLRPVFEKVMTGKAKLSFNSPPNKATALLLTHDNGAWEFYLFGDKCHLISKGKSSFFKWLATRKYIGGFEPIPKRMIERLLMTHWDRYF
ncbi:hypothetical protein EM59_016455 [Vibrio parahaemolyticus]|uniref:hypothetical protein n=1 Tax=Vibrio parahaemolyticus TaxID=670 RepID=UPI0004D81EDA|nr:hypothetical protein [Vibrio parahaemolyticus]EGQ9979473.1 hypothetical protein [Vibrio parahaemolyticus]EJG1824803.1 hypothetical protein [Vibrio parahaemolyticus]ELB2744112.1 hypothetical protein [Vibrio parahaemolyticus]OQU35727.1 hypothetical protein EM59_016455 [Vibrio parahaemolyticus]